MTLLFTVAGLLLAYLLGAIPTGLLIGRAFAGIDLREHGSKNIGFTNAVRVLGPKLGIPVLIIDVGKAWAAVVMLAALLPVPGWFPVAAALVTMFGNMANVFLGFRGGKGVATALGVFLGLMPQAILVALVVFLLVLGVTRYVSAGSIAASVSLPVAAFFLYGFGVLFAVSVVAAGGVIWKHRANVSRLLAGTENRVGRTRREPEAPTEAYNDARPDA